MKADVRGVLYIGSIPSGMTPSILREMLTTFGKINRIYLAPKTTNQSKPNFKRSGFKEGWVEFVSKKDAKRASLLSGLPMNYSRTFKDYIWNLKYLHSFKWADLTSQITYENAVKDQSISSSRSKIRRELTSYIESSDNYHNIKLIDRKRENRPGNDIEHLKAKFRQRMPI